MRITINRLIHTQASVWNAQGTLQYSTTICYSLYMLYTQTIHAYSIYIPFQLHQYTHYIRHIIHYILHYTTQLYTTQCKQCKYVEAHTSFNSNTGVSISTAPCLLNTLFIHSNACSRIRICSGAKSRQPVCTLIIIIILLHRIICYNCYHCHTILQVLYYNNTIIEQYYISITFIL